MGAQRRLLTQPGGHGGLLEGSSRRVFSSPDPLTSPDTGQVPVLTSWGSGVYLSPKSWEQTIAHVCSRLLTWNAKVWPPEGTVASVFVQTDCS